MTTGVGAIRTPQAVAGVRPSIGTLRLLVGLSLFSMASMYFAGQWDLAEHANGAVDSFWYPPHFGIYLGLLLAMILSGVAAALVLRGPGSLGSKIRSNPLLAAMAVANFLDFSGAPFDAWWHETYGIDLTVWSPPHLHILFGATLSLLCAWAFYLDDGPLKRPMALLGRIDWRTLLLGFSGALALALCAFSFSEYEGGLVSREVLARPEWIYPILWSFFVLFMLGVFAGGSRLIGVATFTVVIYTAIRLLGIVANNRLLDFYPPMPYPMLLPAILFDLGLLVAGVRKGGALLWLRLVVVALAVGLLLVVSMPFFGTISEFNARVSIRPWHDWWSAGLLGSVLGCLAGWGSGLLLRRLRPSQRGDELAESGALLEPGLWPGRS